jgi:peptidyl-prolyl cis-trans isomerase D
MTSAPLHWKMPRNERARMESQMGESFSQLAANPDYMKQFRRGVLDRLIDQALIRQQGP